MNIAELRKLAKANGINSYGKSGSALEAELKALGLFGKQGKSTWKPANRLDLLGKDPNYTYRFVRDTPENVAKKRAEGWEFVTATTDPNARAVSVGDVDDGKSVDSVQRQREMVVMRLPNEIAEERRRYHQEIVDTRRKTVTRRAKAEAAAIGPDATVYGPGLTIT